MNRATELRNIIARTDAALEFVPIGEMIDFNIGIAGMAFEDELEPKRDFTKDPMKFEIGMVFTIKAPGHGGKEHYRIYRIMEGVPHHTPIYGLCVDVEIVEEDARGNPNERTQGRFNELQLNSYMNKGQMVITEGDQ